MLVPITEGDVPHVVRLMNRAYRGDGASEGWTTETAYIAGDRTSEDLLRAELATKPEASFLKWEDGEGALQGCVFVEPIGDGVWYLGSLTVDPTRQNAGLGRELLGAAEAWLRAQGARRIRMTVVNVRAPLIAWYERRGYALTNETLSFPYEDERFGRPLRDDLAFVVLEKDLPGFGASS